MGQRGRGVRVWGLGSRGSAVQRKSHNCGARVPKHPFCPRSLRMCPAAASRQGRYVFDSSPDSSTALVL